MFLFQQGVGIFSTEVVLLTQIQTASQDKSSHSFCKLLDKIQQMLLIALSQGNVIPTQLND